MSQRLSWGIMGTGNIARQFCAGVNTSTRSKLTAVGSRTLEAARAFAQTYNVPRALGSYEQLLADPEVQAVYISLPNSMHHEWTLRALQAGKHVLCEKPMASNAAEAIQMFEAAKRAGRLLIEAFMYRAHPLTHAYLKSIREGAIGTVRLIRASFCYRTKKIDGNIRFATDLAGGGLMDVGTYCINFARMVAGEEPTTVSAVGQKHASGVDLIAAGLLKFPSGIIATIDCGMAAQANNLITVSGTDGYIEIPIAWKPPASGATYTIGQMTPPRQEMTGPGALKTTPNSGPRQTITIDAGGELYGIEADAFAASVFDGAPPFVTAADTIGNMRVLDETRKQLGIIT